MGCHEQQEVYEKRPKPRNSPSHNHDSTARRQHPLIYTGAGPIHPVHGPLRSPATEAIAPKGFTFLPFWRAYLSQNSISTIVLAGVFKIYKIKVKEVSEAGRNGCPRAGCGDVYGGACYVDATSRD